jgi:DNA polymerase IV
VDRVILHCDLNNFYASVECLYNPSIRDKAVAVCGSQSTRHGIVLAKNYRAKEYGVKTGEPVWEAAKKCPDLFVVKPHYSMYLKFSRMAMETYKDYTDLIEAFGIDECWLDVTESSRLFGTGEKIAYTIKERIKNELGLTISVGVSFNKVFAKLGSDMKKPDAVTVISRQNYTSLVWNLPVHDLMYVGRSTRDSLNKIGIMSIGDLAGAPCDFLIKKFGQWGQTLWIFANGFDSSPVTASGHAPLIKGIGNSLTTSRDLICNEDVKSLIYVLSDSVGERLRKHNLKGRTIQIGIRSSSLSYIERQGQLGRYTDISSEIAEAAFGIFIRSWNWDEKIRLVGVRVTNLVTADDYIQLSFFTDDKRLKKNLLDKSIDRIRQRFGHYSVQRAFLLKHMDLNANPVEENVIHPVSYFRP